MNAQALIRDRYSLSDVEQVMQFVEQILSTYTWAILALMVLIAAVAGCRAIIDRRQSKKPVRVTPASHGRQQSPELKTQALRTSELKSLSLDQSSVY
jgi:hypothetical protein